MTTDFNYRCTLCTLCTSCGDAALLCSVKIGNDMTKSWLTTKFTKFTKYTRSKLSIFWADFSFIFCPELIKMMKKVVKRSELMYISELNGSFRRFLP